MIAALGEEISGNCSAGQVTWGLLPGHGKQIDAKGEEKCSGAGEERCEREGGASLVGDDAGIAVVADPGERKRCVNEVGCEPAGGVCTPYPTACGGE